MQDVRVHTHVSVLVCTDFFVFVMEKCLLFPLLVLEHSLISETWGSHWSNTTVSFLFFFLGELLKSAAKIYPHNILQKEAGHLCIALAVASDQSGSLSPNRVFLSFSFLPTCWRISCRDLEPWISYVTGPTNWANHESDIDKLKYVEQRGRGWGQWEEFELGCLIFYRNK